MTVSVLKPLRHLGLAALLASAVAGCSVREAADMIPMNVQTSIVTEDAIKDHVNGPKTADAEEKAGSDAALLAEAQAKLAAARQNQLAQGGQFEPEPTNSQTKPTADQLFQSYMTSSTPQPEVKEDNAVAKLQAMLAAREKQKQEEPVTTGSIQPVAKPQGFEKGAHETEISGLEEKARLRRAALLVETAKKAEPAPSRIAARAMPASAQAPKPFMQTVRFQPGQSSLNDGQKMALKLQSQALFAKAERIELAHPKLAPEADLKAKMLQQAQINSLKDVLPQDREITIVEDQALDADALQIRLYERATP